MVQFTRETRNLWVKHETFSWNLLLPLHIFIIYFTEIKKIVMLLWVSISIESSWEPVCHTDNLTTASFLWGWVMYSSLLQQHYPADGIVAVRECFTHLCKRQGLPQDSHENKVLNTQQKKTAPWSQSTSLDGSSSASQKSSYLLILLEIGSFLFSL